MRRWFFLLFLFILIELPAAQLSTLQERFQRAQVGDYVVLEEGKSYSLLLIRSLAEKRMVLEEVRIPEVLLPKIPRSWPEWLSTKAPGHTSWMLYEIDLSEGLLIRSSSISEKKGEFPENTVLKTLFRLPLQKLPEQERKRIGPPPQEGVDTRRVWTPPFIWEGKKRKKEPCEVWRTFWPNDKTELANSRIDLYFTQKQEDFPFPFWIEISNGHYTLKIRAVDAGKHLSSPLSFAK